ncbi:hypothetical protein H257_16309 [Aphanomyces astaci]|uniref:Uncharacterized protein n=1 Tax=Aphanomyces astaci TaxID=112090 RepID=W4FLN7_APHAT|nr:hypothetical protein H257_16309 [Aphanomyces astaci]ETV67583.1 hypothetical protein H257_16309 [Aphanomyces astaci]|eukprot:XP_009842987.1 hypothetical protein H257_16309 [Aphanomyces astaci]
MARLPTKNTAYRIVNKTRARLSNKLKIGAPLTAKAVEEAINCQRNPCMSKNKAREKKEFRKAERAAAASSKVIQRDQNILLRKASQRKLVSFNVIHYLKQSDVENLDTIRMSLIEKIRTVERVNERFQRDLRRTWA